MTEIITINQILVLAITNIVSGVFIGAGISIGMYTALKKQVPKWIHEITFELRKMSAMDKALSYQRGNQNENTRYA